MISKPRQGRKLHPIWTGIGCAMLILIPLISWGLADVLVDYLVATYPDLALDIGKANPGGVNILYLKIGSAVILSILIYLLFTILSSLFYTLLGGSRDAEIASRIGSGKRR
ncbi:MAG TPA: hypothetical protein VI688_02410 [Anaerolineales bacterium]|nr:hypothetical protein [Anaerolineales bacterium]